MSAEPMKCGRCGVVDDAVLDLDTGGRYHPEPGQCITSLRDIVRELLLVHRWQNCRSGSEKSMAYSRAVRRALLATNGPVRVA